MRGLILGMVSATALFGVAAMPRVAEAQTGGSQGWSAGGNWSPGPQGPAVWGPQAPQPGAPSAAAATDLEVGTLVRRFGWLWRGNRHLARCRAGHRRSRAEVHGARDLGLGGAGRGFLLGPAADAARHAGRDSQPAWPSAPAKGSASPATSSCTRKTDNQWGFRGFARSVFIGSTVGAGAGLCDGGGDGAVAEDEPSARQQRRLGHRSIGSMFGYGGSAADSGSATPTTRRRSAGSSVTTSACSARRRCRRCGSRRTNRSRGCGSALAPVSASRCPFILLYAGGDHDARRGLIFQGTAATLGLLRGRSSRSIPRTSPTERASSGQAQGGHPGDRRWLHAGPRRHGLPAVSGLLF